MSEQQSRKRGVRSSAQKEDRARQPRAPMPAANRVAGAFGDPGPERISDQELSLAFEERLAKQKKRKTPRREID